MAKFKLVLDTRVKKKDNKYNLCVRYTDKSDVMYLNIVDMTENNYKVVFEKLSMEQKSIEFREKCFAYITKAEKIYSTLQPFDKKKFREMFYSTTPMNEGVNSQGETDLQKLFDDYIANSTLKEITKGHYRYSLRILKTYKEDITLNDIVPGFLNQFDHQKRVVEKRSKATVDSLMRNLRAVINYHMKVTKCLPPDFEYPFSKGNYIISSYFPSKQVLSNDEIQSVIDFKDFENKNQEYARDIWLALYRLNGINYADLLQMKWSDVKGNFIEFTRRKTETTRKNNIKPIIVPYNDKVKEIIERIGVKTSPFILGKLREDFSENTFNNCSHKNKQKININLRFLNEKLNLSVPLKIETARDSYATTLLRADKPIEQISTMLGHSNVIVTEHYLGSRNPEKTFAINDVIM